MKKISTFIILALLLTLPYWLQDPYYQHIVITTGLFIIGAMSLNLMLGYTGQQSRSYCVLWGGGVCQCAHVVRL